MEILGNDERLVLTGRIELSDPAAPVLVYPGSAVSFRFRGTHLTAKLSNICGDWKSFAGVRINDRPLVIPLKNDGRPYEYPLAEGLSDTVHEVLFYKRQDSCHDLTVHGFSTDGEFCPAKETEKNNTRRMEFFGDSVTVGEVAEASDYAGKEDPPCMGEYTDAYDSYAWQTARLLHADVHLTAVSGIALFDNTGYFCAKDENATGAIGMETVYDKLRCNPENGALTPWDFSRYQPQVVVVAIGQNDANPVDYMAKDPDGEAAKRWKRGYRDFIEKLCDVYPKATFILTTTIMEHDLSWDRAILSVAKELREAGKPVHRFFFSRTASGTPGHIRTAEAAVMAKELSDFISSLGEEIWKDE